MTAWTEHVKAYALEHKIPYKEAMTKAGATYKKSEEVKPVEVVPEVKPEVKPEEVKVEDKVVGETVAPKKVKRVRKGKDAFPLDVEAIKKSISVEELMQLPEPKILKIKKTK